MVEKEMLLKLRYLFRWPSIRATFSLAIASMLFLCVVFFIYWWPLFKHADSNMHLIKEMRAQILQKAADNELFTAYSEGKKDVNLFESGLLTEGSRSGAMSSVGQLASRSGIEIVSESFAKAGRKNRFDVFYYDLNIQGGYKNLRVFLTGLDDISVRFYVQEIEIQKNQDAVEAHLRLAAYRKGDEKGAAF